MKIIEFFAKKHILVNLLAVFVTAAGFYTFLTSPKEALPEIKFGLIVIQTLYPSAAPQEVEKLITTPIEEAIDGIKGIDSITSSSSEGVSIVSITLKSGIKDASVILNDIKGAIDKIRTLPADAQDPVVSELTTDEFPVIQLSVSGGSNYGELREAAKFIENKLSKIRGVTKVDKIGYYDKVIWVESDAEKERKYGVTLFNIANALRNRNISIPAGNKVFDGYENSIRALAEIKDSKDVGGVILRSNDVGRYINIADVADVYEGFSDSDFLTRADGETAILFTILKTSGDDTLRISRDVKENIKSIKTLIPPSVRIKFSNDTSLFVKDRLNIVFSNGIAGAFLVVAILLLMLRPSIAVMTALGLPVAFGLALITLKALGLSYNMLSLFGFVMALGLLVDDAIVVGENVFRHMEMGKSAMQSAVDGAAEMVIPVTASVATTIAAFFPLLMVGGVLGSFLAPIPTAIIIAITASLMECYIILPSHLAYFGQFGGSGRLAPLQDSFTNTLKNIYLKALTPVLKHRWKFIGVMMVIFLGAVFAGGMKGVEFFSQETDAINIKIKCDNLFSITDTDKVVRQIEQKLDGNLLKDDVETIFYYIGKYPNSQGQPETGSNLAQIEIYLKLKAERKTKDTNDVISAVRQFVGKPEGVTDIKISGVTREGGPGRNDIDYSVVGDSYEKLQPAVLELITAAKTISGVTEISADLEQGKKELRLIMDEKKASQAGIMLSDIGMMLRGAVAGVKVTSIKRDGEDIDVIVKAKDSEIKSLDDLLSLKIPNRTGANIPLKNLVSIEKGYSYSVLKHKDTKKAISVLGSIDKKETTVNSVNSKLLEKIAALKMKYPDVEFITGGEFKEMRETFRSLGNAFAVALFLIFIILATLFNSLIQPFIIMLAIPFGFMGVMLTLAIHGMPVSFGAFMGFVGLSGVVVNNSLIMTDFINKNIKSGIAFEEAVLSGAISRLRPIFLTTATTAAGLLPLGYGLFGANDPFLKPVALVFAWGLIFSTVVTLFMIPVFTVMMHNLKVTFLRVFRKDKNNEYAFKK